MNIENKHSSQEKVRDFIVFAEDWGALPSSTQHLIKYLSKNRNVIWVNSIGLRSPNLSFKDMKRLWFKLTSRSKPELKPSKNPTQTNVPTNFRVVHPKTIPVPKSRFARWIAKKLLRTQILKVAESFELYQPVLWVSLPTAVDMIGELNESACLYYCGDDFSGLAGVDHETVSKREQELAKKADLIFTASEVLNRKFPANKTHTLTHGVDYDLFVKPTNRATDLPNRGKPIAGFYGSISEWLDLKLLTETIQKMPHWDFVFIGKPEIDISQINSMENTFFLGSKPHHQLPEYSQHWQVALLPFIDNKQIRACNPLKLKEYLAVGKPIISTYFNAIEPYKKIISVIDNSESMMQAIENSLHEDEQDKASFIQKRRNAVSLQSWKAKAEIVEKTVNTVLN